MPSSLPRVVPLTSDPGWYFESRSLAWWLSNLFDQPVEVHAFEIGLLVGVLFGVLAFRNHPGVMGLVLLPLAAFLFGTFDVPLVCETRTTTCAHVQLKPWYFLSGVVLAQVGVLGAISRLGDPDDQPSREVVGSDR